MKTRKRLKLKKRLKGRSKKGGMWCFGKKCIQSVREPIQSVREEIRFEPEIRLEDIYLGNPEDTQFDKSAEKDIKKLKLQRIKNQKKQEEIERKLDEIERRKEEIKIMIKNIDETDYYIINKILFISNYLKNNEDDPLGQQLPAKLIELFNSKRNDIKGKIEKLDDVSLSILIELIYEIE
jgi:hypothetical protein